jgi:hypothetical protein
VTNLLSSSYQPPGVYVEDISQDIVFSLGTPENLLCIVAPARGHQDRTEDVMLFSVTPTELDEHGIVQDDTLVLRTLTGQVLVLDADYTVATETIEGEVHTKVTRLPINPATPSPVGVVDGQVVHVSYGYTDSTYYSPKRFSDYVALSAVYGPALSSDPSASDPILSQMSLAAKIAFENGAGEILAMPVDHSTASWQDDFKSTYAKLATDHRVSVLVVITPDSETDTGLKLDPYLLDLRTHCDDAAANGFGRTILTSGSRTYDEVNRAYEVAATTVANKRIVVVYPTRFNITNQLTSQIVEVGGCYAAAALGGRLVYNKVEKSLTRQVVRSFASIPASVQQKMSMSFKNNLSANGVCVIETDQLNRLVVRHGLTTDTTKLTHSEISLVRISDVLVQNIQVGLDNSGLIGDPIDDDMTMRVKGALTGLLERAVNDDVIVSYTQLLVRQQSLPNGDPSVIECQFSYRPAVPLNYIVVKFSLNMSTGVVTDSSGNSFDDSSGLSSGNGSDDSFPHS